MKTPADLLPEIEPRNLEAPAHYQEKAYFSVIQESLEKSQRFLEPDTHALSEIEKALAARSANKGTIVDQGS